MTPLSALARLASTRHHVVSVAELFALGFTPDGIRHLVRKQHLFRLHRGVYAVGRSDVTQLGRWRAAVLACGKGAALSHQSACVFWRLLTHDPPCPHILLPLPASGRGPRGVTVHTSRTFAPSDATVRSQIRVTTLVRTLHDVALAGLDDVPLRAAVRAASRDHHIDLARLRDQPRLREIVRLYDPLLDLTESELEAAFLELCLRFALPLPDPQVNHRPGRVDFTWPEHRLIVECDSRRWHDNDFAFRDDRARDRALRRDGWEPLRFTWAEVVFEPALVAAELEAAFASRAARSA